MTTIGTTLGGLPLNIDTDARTFEELRTTLLDAIRGLSPEWTDFFPSDPGVVMLEAVAALAAGVHYQLDRTQNEGYLRTAQQRAAVEEILRLVGYEMSPPASAAVELTVTTDRALVLPVGWSVAPQTGGPTFSLLEAVTIPGAGTWRPTDIPNMVAVAGELVTDSLGTSSGRPRQRYFSTRSDYAVASTDYPAAVVRVDGVIWDLVPSFIDSQPGDNHVRVLYSSTGKALVGFGDGIRGAIPPGGAPITLTAIYGGGRLTNSVGTGALVRQLVAVTGVLAVVNTVPPSGGRDAETPDEAKTNAPLTFRSQDRAVTLEDYATQAKAASPSVLSARAVHAETGLSVRLAFSVAGDNPVPTGRWYPLLESGTGLVGLVGRYVQRRATTPYLDVVAATAVRPVLRIEVLLHPGAFAAEVHRQIDIDLRALYATKGSLDSNLLGLSDVVGVIEQVRGVNIVNVLEFRRVPAFRLDRGTQTTFDQATKLVQRVYDTVEQGDYKVLWMNSDVYRLTSSRHGTIMTAGRDPQNFTTGVTQRVVLYGTPTPRAPAERWQFDIRIDTGVSKPRRGDVWRFGVDFFAGNLALAPEEVVSPTVVGVGEARRISPDELVVTFAGR